MDDVLVNMSTMLKTRRVVIEADSNAAMKRGMASPPTSKSATPKPIRRNEERFRRLSLENIQMFRIFPATIKVAKNPKHNLQNIFHVLRSMAVGCCFYTGETFWYQNKTKLVLCYMNLSFLK